MVPVRDSHHRSHRRDLHTRRRRRCKDPHRPGHRIPHRLHHPDQNLPRHHSHHHGFPGRGRPHDHRHRQGRIHPHREPRHLVTGPASPSPTSGTGPGRPSLGATAATYTPAAADAAKTLTVRVTGSRTGYTTLTKTSPATTAITPGSLAGAVPTITGTAKVGSTLTANPGTWSPAPVTLTYQWYRSGTAILGATAATYTPAAADAAKTLTVRVTGSRTGYTTLTKTSPATTAITTGSLAGAVPTITGTPKVGSTLTANPGTWSPAPVTLTYQWYRSGTAIIGATAATYTPTAADAAKTLTVRVTGSRTGYTTLTKTSPATTAIAT